MRPSAGTRSAKSIIQPCPIQLTFGKEGDTLPPADLGNPHVKRTVGTPLYETLSVDPIEKDCFDPSKILYSVSRREKGKKDLYPTPTLRPLWLLRRHRCTPLFELRAPAFISLHCFAALKI